jgi:hypothetical protein
MSPHQVASFEIAVLEEDLFLLIQQIPRGQKRTLQVVSGVLMMWEDFWPISSIPRG